MEPEGSVPCSQEPSTGPYNHRTLTPEDGNRSSFRNVLLSITGRWTQSKNLVILSVTHHRQNPSEASVSVQRVRISAEARDFFSISRRPDRFWGPPSVLSNGRRGKAAGAWSWPLIYSIADAKTFLASLWRGAGGDNIHDRWFRHTLIDKSLETNLQHRYCIRLISFYYVSFLTCLTDI
jgi:hypothetical protein